MVGGGGFPTTVQGRRKGGLEPPPPQYFGLNYCGHTHSYNRIHTAIDL